MFNYLSFRLVPGAVPIFDPMVCSTEMDQSYSEAQIDQASEVCNKITG